jgi:hypothetical protein
MPSMELTLGKTDADILLIFLSANGIIFKKTNDPCTALIASSTTAPYTSTKTQATLRHIT